MASSIHDSEWSVYAGASAAKGHACQLIFLYYNDGGSGQSSEAHLYNLWGWRECYWAVHAGMDSENVRCVVIRGAQTRPVCHEGQVGWPVLLGASVKHDPDRMCTLVKRCQPEAMSDLIQLLQATDWMCLSLRHITDCGTTAWVGRTAAGVHDLSETRDVAVNSNG